jgi:adenylosuccinate synthase
VLGIVKAYTTRVGAGPFPTELFDDVGVRLGERGQEFGATTGRPRRCGWIDTVALRRSVRMNSLTGLCVTKLDVLDGLDPVRLCVGYRVGGEVLDSPPLMEATSLAACEPVYEDMSGWSDSTAGLTRVEALPASARAYLDRLAELTGAPVDMISTGPDRMQTITLRHPFG